MLKVSGLIFLGLLVVAFAPAGVSGQQNKPNQQSQSKELKHIPLSDTNPQSGRQMYKEYCAACHGIQGKGDGPAVEILKAPPSNLTTLAKRNNGEYPTMKVMGVLQFGTPSHVHGTAEMPLWGPLFESQSNRSIAKLRINNLTEFIESLQQK